MVQNVLPCLIAEVHIPQLHHGSGGIFRFRGHRLLLRLGQKMCIRDRHITSQACQMFADLVNEKTDGRITIECHFAGELGDERSTICLLYTSASTIRR